MGCSDVYGGEYPFSEKEMIAWKDFFTTAAKTTQLISYISIHNYGQRILSPYAASKSDFPEEPFSLKELNEAGKLITDAMSSVFNQKYKFGQSRDLLYPSSGTSK